MYVKKLEYSADKVSVLQQLKSSAKKKGKQQDRSMEIDTKEQDFFKINKHDRKNTLSGHKRTLNLASSEDSPEKYPSYKRRSISNDSEIHLVNVKKDNPISTMIKITNNCNDFLKAYASANSGDSSGSNKIEKVCLEKQHSFSKVGYQQQRPSHVRFNSLAEISHKFKKQKKYKLKDINEANNSFSGMRNVLGKIDTNIENSQHSFLNNHPEHYRRVSEGAEMLNYSYDNLQGNQGSENKENINLLESNHTIEDKIDHDAPMDSMMYSNRIFGIDKRKDISNPSEGYNDRPKCNCKKSRCLKLYCDCFSSGLGCVN